MANGEVVRTGIPLETGIQARLKPDQILISKEGDQTFEMQRNFFLSNDETARIIEKSIIESPKKNIIIGLLNNEILGKTKDFFTETECKRILKEHNLRDIFQNTGNLAGYLDLMIEQRDIPYVKDIVNLR